MPPKRCSLLTMTLMIVDKKEEFDQIQTDDQQPYSKKFSKQSKSISNENVQNQQKSTGKQQKNLDKIIPRWGIVPKKEIITKKKQLKQNHSLIEYNGYHRTQYYQQQSRKVKQQNTLKQQILQKLTKKYYSVIKNTSISKILKSSLPKIINKFQQEQWADKNIVSLLVEKLLKKQQSKTFNKIEVETQELKNTVQKQEIRKVIQQIYQDWTIMNVEAQNMGDKTINYKEKSFDSLPELHKPYKSRTVNHHTYLLKFLKNSYCKINKIEQITQNADHVFQISQKIKKFHQKQKNQSKFIVKKFSYLGKKFNLKNSLQVQNVLLQKYEIDKNKNYHQLLLISDKKWGALKQQFIQKHQKKIYSKKQKKYIKSKRQIEFEAFNPQKRNRLKKTDEGWQRTYISPQPFRYTEISFQSQQGKNKQNEKQVSLVVQQSLIESQKYASIQQVLRNLDWLIVPQQNIFSYCIGTYKRQNQQQNSNQWQRSQFSESISHQKTTRQCSERHQSSKQSFEKQDDINNSDSTIYQQDENTKIQE